jgi:hypothetical protein
MKEKGMIFTGDSVWAILAWRKTQTRRIVKGVEPFEELLEIEPGRYRHYLLEHGWLKTGPIITAPYQVGQRVWVRESFACANDGIVAFFKADYTKDDSGERAGWWMGESYIGDVKWHSPLYMPRWASRIDLLITGVKAERVQDIPEDDAYLEGITGGDSMGDPVGEYAKQWDTIHGPGAWDRNDWVFAYTFERVKP